MFLFVIKSQINKIKPTAEINNPIINNIVANIDVPKTILTNAPMRTTNAPIRKTERGLLTIVFI